MKNIIVCSDRTRNSDIKGRGASVFKLLEAVNLRAMKPIRRSAVGCAVRTRIGRVGHMGHGE